MKKIIFYMCLSTAIIAGCHKDQIHPPSLNQRSIIGKWNIDTVITYFYDSTGLREKGVHIYPVGAPDYPYNFQFNTDSTFLETMHLSSDPDYIISNGTYSFTSDDSFTLTYPTAVAGKEVEPCKITLLTNTSLSFSKQLATIFNGTDPGYIKYDYKLSR